QGFNAIIAQVKLHLEGSIGHPPSLFQEVDNLVEDGIEIHYRPSSSSCNNAFASMRSAVSKPSVNQLYTGASRSWASLRLPCCSQSRARLVTLRSSHDLACWLWAILMA